MGKPKKLTPAELEAKTQAYFDAIRYTEKIFTEETMYQDDGRGNAIPMLDRFGHILKRRVPVIAVNGMHAEKTVWTVQPKIIDLCRSIGISTTTWEKYGKDPRYAQTVQRAREMVESYLQEKLMTKDGLRGAKFALEHNFGWTDKREIGFDEGTRESVASLAETMGMKEKENILRSISKQITDGGLFDDAEENY